MTRLSASVAAAVRARLRAHRWAGGHSPDVLAVTADGSHWLLDVRPAGRIKPPDAVKFAASREAATTFGWRYSVITGWGPHVLSGLDAQSAQRRPLTDQLGCLPVLLAAAVTGLVCAGFGMVVLVAGG